MARPMRVTAGKTGQVRAKSRSRSASPGSPPPNSADSAFVRTAQRLEKRGQIDEALDLVYDSVDDMMRKLRFTELAKILATVQTADLSTDLLLSLLTTTLPARSQLPSRKQFFHRVEASLKERGEYENGLLAGLEG